MHEASLAGGVLSIVEQAARREGFKRVGSIRLEVGQLAGVELRALQFALEAMAPGTLLEGARFEFDQPPGVAWCLACGRETPLAQRGEPCQHCGGYQVQPTGGTEFRVVDLMVED